VWIGACIDNETSQGRAIRVAGSCGRRAPRLKMDEVHQGLLARECAYVKKECAHLKQESHTRSRKTGTIAGRKLSSEDETGQHWSETTFLGTKNNEPRTSVDRPERAKGPSCAYLLRMVPARKNLTSSKRSAHHRKGVTSEVDKTSRARPDATAD